LKTKSKKAKRCKKKAKKKKGTELEEPWLEGKKIVSYVHRQNLKNKKQK